MIASPLHATALRLRPGDDLRRSLLEFAAVENLTAACILSGVGSLADPVLRFADQPEGRRLSGKFEIIALSGTLGEGGAHLHLAVADSAGVVSAGHLVDGSRVYTTAEIVLGILPQLAFRRVPDPATGFRELLVSEA
ncbi:MAG: DNA-binding protein [Verrucomicrobiales bacterium]